MDKTEAELDDGLDIAGGGLEAVCDGCFRMPLVAVILWMRAVKGNMSAKVMLSLG